jgi:hypothetical protein
MKIYTMDNTVLAILIVFILIIFYLCCYNPPHEHLKVSSPYGYYVKEAQKNPLDMSRSEEMVNQKDWADMSRGLNYSIGGGYSPVIQMLNEMEKAQGKDIQTDNRQLDPNMW